MKRSRENTIILVCIMVVLLALTLYFVWYLGEKHTIANNGIDTVQVVKGVADGFKGKSMQQSAMKAGK